MVSRKRKRWLVFFSVFVFIVLLVVIFRVNILRSIGNGLVYKDTLEPCEAVFVLSGSPDERAKHAAHLHKKGYAPRIICTGSITPENVEILGLDTKEAQITQAALIKRYQVTDSVITCLPEGTSTKEEADAILNYAEKHHLSKIMIVSTAFHTNRVKYIFRKKFKRNKNIKICIQPAPAMDYNERYWWKDEEGLLTVYTEYAKKMYYFFKY
jgi:uncharacterized SAM-binding protein YcdF (DUF218 family)